MLNKKHKPITEPYHRNTINVVLQDGYRIRINNKATRLKISFSEAVRQAVKNWLA